MKPSVQISAFAWLALNFLGYFCAFGVVQPFFPLWLQSHHHSEFFIAFVMSSAYLFRFLGGLLLSKRVKRLDALFGWQRGAAWRRCWRLRRARGRMGCWWRRFGCFLPSMAARCR